MEWTIFYGDGSTFSNIDGDWKDAPGWGVIAIVYRDPEDGWAIAHQGDFYVIAENGTVVPIGSDGLLDYAVNVLGMKSGRMVDRITFQRIFQDAKDYRNVLIRSEVD